MSTSSRRLKEHELGKLFEAQRKAALLPDYYEWLDWMRTHHNYAMAVRMSTHLGIKLPGRDFYLEMAKRGQKLVEQEAA